MQQYSNEHICSNYNQSLSIHKEIKRYDKTTQILYHVNQYCSGIADESRHDLPVNIIVVIVIRIY